MNLADLKIGVGVDTRGTKQEFDKIPGMAEKAAKEAESKFAGLGKKIAAGVAVGGAAIGAGLIAAIGVGMDRERLGDKLGAQLNLTKAESERAGAVAGALYADAYGESIEQVHAAVGTVISSLPNLPDSQVEGITAKALDLASAFDLDVSQAVQSAGQLMTTGLVDDADEAFDLITAGLQSVPQAMREELFPIMDEYGKHFADLGFDGEEAMAVVVAASEDGTIAMDKVGDALKELTIRATDMSTASEEAYEAAGLDMEDMAGMILAGGDTAREGFDQIIEGLLSIKDPVAQANAAIGLFGTPIEDLGTAQIPAFLESLRGVEGTMGDVEGAAGRMGDMLNDNAATRFESLKRGGMDLIAQLGEKLLPVFEKVLEWATVAGPKLMELVGGAFEKIAETAGKVSDWWAENGPTIIDKASEMAGVVRDVLLNAFQLLSDWWSANGPAITTFALNLASGVKAAFEGLVTAAAWVRDNWEKVRPVLTVIATVITTLLIPHYVALGIAALKSAAKNVTAWVMNSTASVRHGATILWSIGKTIAAWALMGVQSLIHAAKVAAAWVIAMGPIGWVITAVVGLVALIIANWDTVKEWTKAAWEWVSEKIAAVWDWITGVVSTGVDAVVGFFTGLRDRAVSIVTNIRDAVVGFFTNLRDKIVEAVTKAKDWVIEKIVALKDGAIDTLVSLLQWWAGLPARFISALGDLGAMLFNAGKAILTGLWNGLKSVWEDVSGWVGGLGSKIADLKGPLEADKKLLVKQGEAIMGGLGKGLTSGWADNERLIGGMSASLQGSFGANVPGVSGAGGSVSQGGGGGNTTVFVLTWEDFVRKVREAGVDINRLGWTG